MTCILKVQLNVSVFFKLVQSWSSVALRHFGSESLILRKEVKPTRDEPGIIASHFSWAKGMANGHGREQQNFEQRLLVFLGVWGGGPSEQEKPLVYIIKTKKRLGDRA